MKMSIFECTQTGALTTVARVGVGLVCGIAGGVEWVDIVGAGSGGCGVWGCCCGLYSTSSRSILG